MGWLKKDPTEILDHGLGILDQAVTDKDKLLEMKFELMKSFGQAMLTGKGESITKVTICGLTIVVVLIGAWVFLFRPAIIASYKDFAIFSGSLIMGLGGYYLTGTTLQEKKPGK
jgi:hypothetical protein